MDRASTLFKEIKKDRINGYFMGSIEKKIIVQKNWISVMEDKFKMPYNPK